MLEPIYGSSIGGYISMTALVVEFILFVILLTLFILDMTGEIDISSIPFIMLTACIGVLIFVETFGIVKINNDEKANVEAAIEADYPGAVMIGETGERGQFSFNGHTYNYMVKNKELVISSTEATTNDTKADSTAVVKSIILEKYPSAKINYTDENSTGYFEYENEFYSFTVENNNIIVKDNTGKMINVLQIN